jgi:hypothetical protein
LANSDATRATPFKSSRAVDTIWTRLSGSSTQSTGTSSTRSPLCSAMSSSSVSKNQALSATSGSSFFAMSVRMALNPHWASRNRLRNTMRRMRL